jgi:ATP-dependent Clp protease adapter protein ClpS
MRLYDVTTMLQVLVSSCHMRGAGKCIMYEQSSADTDAFWWNRFSNFRGTQMRST